MSNSLLALHEGPGLRLHDYLYLLSLDLPNNGQSAVSTSPGMTKPASNLSPGVSDCLQRALRQRARDVERWKEPTATFEGLTTQPSIDPPSSARWSDNARTL